MVAVGVMGVCLHVIFVLTCIDQGHAPMLLVVVIKVKVHQLKEVVPLILCDHAIQLLI